MLRAVLIEDILSTRKQNRTLIEQYCPTVQIVGEAGTVEESISVINTLLPDLLFLDIDLAGESSLTILPHINTIRLKIIFITAFDSYAVKAFRLNAIDYLLKPLLPNQLIEAVKKAEEEIKNQSLSYGINELLKNIDSATTENIILKTITQVYSVTIADIIHCKADNIYTTFFLKDGRKIIVSVSLKEYETVLAEKGFFRTHKSHLVNLKHFDHLNKTDSVVVMKDGTEVPLSVRKKDEFMERIHHI